MTFKLSYGPLVQENLIATKIVLTYGKSIERLLPAVVDVEDDPMLINVFDKDNPQLNFYTEEISNGVTTQTVLKSGELTEQNV